MRVIPRFAMAEPSRSAALAKAGSLPGRDPQKMHTERMSRRSDTPGDYQTRYAPPVGAAVDALGLVGTTVEAVVFDACVDSGGFGLVYRGRHTGLDEPVAIKCLRVAGLNSSDAD